MLNCWFYQLPKATVQASLGAVAYATQVIQSPGGLNRALFISQTCAFTLLIYGPLGTICTFWFGSPISVYLAKLDKEAEEDKQDEKIVAKSLSDEEVTNVETSKDVSDLSKYSFEIVPSDIT
jgi:hypothetical protein